MRSISRFSHPPKPARCAPAPQPSTGHPCAGICLSQVYSHPPIRPRSRRRIPPLVIPPLVIAPPVIGPRAIFPRVSERPRSPERPQQQVGWRPLVTWPARPPPEIPPRLPEIPPRLPEIPPRLPEIPPRLAEIPPRLAAPHRTAPHRARGRARCRLSSTKTRCAWCARARSG